MTNPNSNKVIFHLPNLESTDDRNHNVPSAYRGSRSGGPPTSSTRHSPTTHSPSSTISHTTTNSSNSNTNTTVQSHASISNPTAITSTNTNTTTNSDTDPISSTNTTTNTNTNSSISHPNRNNNLRSKRCMDSSTEPEQELSITEVLRIKDRHISGLQRRIKYIEECKKKERKQRYQEREKERYQERQEKLSIIKEKDEYKQRLIQSIEQNKNTKKKYEEMKLFRDATIIENKQLEKIIKDLQEQNKVAVQEKDKESEDDDDEDNDKDNDDHCDHHSFINVGFVFK